MSTPTQRHLRSLAGRALLRLAAALASAQGTLVRLASSASRTPRPDPKDTARAAGDGMDTDMPDRSVAPPGPDLEFVGTRDLFKEIAARYDACMIVCVRHTGRDDGSCSAVFLAHGVKQTAGFLRSAAELAEESQMRDLRGDDL